MEFALVDLADRDRTAGQRRLDGAGDDRRIAAAHQHRAAAHDLGGVVAAEGDLRQGGERGGDRQQETVEITGWAFLARLDEILEAHRLRLDEGADRAPPEGDDVAKRTKGPAHVAGERADIGALAAGADEGGDAISRRSLAAQRDALLEDPEENAAAIACVEEQMRDRVEQVAGDKKKAAAQAEKERAAEEALAEVDGIVVGTCALFPHDKAAELSCVAVRESFQNQPGLRVGTHLVEAAERLAAESGITRLFVLTTQAHHWFERAGFTLATVDYLPMEKKQLYNLQRQSKVLFKTVESV